MEDTPGLMKQWIDLLNKFNAVEHDRNEAIQAYSTLHMSFVHIHPFIDGNGRMARLLANLPVLKSGLPPITIR